MIYWMRGICVQAKLQDNENPKLDYTESIDYSKENLKIHTGSPSLSPSPLFLSLIHI